MSQTDSPRMETSSIGSSRSFSSASMDDSNPTTPNVAREEVNSRLERKDFPNTINSASTERKGTPKSLRFRMISPSNSNASTSSYETPVVVRPIAPPNPILFKTGNHTNDFSNVQRKNSIIATVNGDDDSSSSGEFRHITVGNPTQVEIQMDQKSTASTSTFNSHSTTNTASSVNLSINKGGSPTILLPMKGRTHCNALIASERPNDDNDYFQFQFPPNKRGVGVVIPFFNEEERELRRTLESLEAQAGTILRTKNLNLHVLLIMDGWSKAADTMRDYVKHMFPASNPALPWWIALEDKSQQDTVETFFVQKIVPYGKKKSNRCISIGESPITMNKDGKKNKKMYITLIIKRDNRRKHNSHEWFFGRGGFAEFYKHELLFATDCGTLFETDCLLSLISYMESNPTVSVSTGRQRVMTRAQQESTESLFSLGTMYRMAQCYDYESSFACFMGAFALFGFLPVIPGPCGLYRASDMLGAPRDWYFDVVNTDPDKSGMVLGNLRIAEDRVLSYAAVLKTEEPRRMALIPEATFYFEAECSLEKFLLQRRRWTNGTVAGYIYMCLQNPSLLFKANMNPLRKIFVYFLLMCQVLVYTVVAVSPAIFLLSLHSTFKSIFPLPNFPQTYPEIVWYICIALYVGMVITHSKTKFKAWMFYSLLVVAMATIAGAFWTFGYYVYHNGVTFGGEGYQWISIWTVIFVTCLPLVIAFLHSLKSFGLMVISVIPYYLMLPMMVAWFSAYAFSRTWDLTWGNRPASAEHTTHAGANKVNIEKELKAKAMTLCIFVVMSNLLFILIVEQLQHVEIAILILAGFIFTFSILQMVLSCIYFVLYYDPRRIIELVWRIATLPFKKQKNEIVEEESSDEEEEVFYENYKQSGSGSGSENSGKIQSSRSVSSVRDSDKESADGNKIIAATISEHVKPTRTTSLLRNSSNAIKASRSDLLVPSRSSTVGYDIKPVKSRTLSQKKLATSLSTSSLKGNGNGNGTGTGTGIGDSNKIRKMGSKNSDENFSEIKPSKSKTMVIISPSIHDDDDSEDEEDIAEVLNDDNKFGPVKRTPSYANAV